MFANIQRENMNRIINFLGSIPGTTILISIGYLIFVTVSHDQMQRPAYWIQDKLSHRTWNMLVAITSLLILLIIGLWTIRHLKNHSRRIIALGYGMITIILAFISFKTLLVMNIEVVHFPQYAILSIFVFAIVGRYGETMMWVTFGGMIDEAFQYYYFYGDRGIHYDFNDVVLNQLGAGIGLVLIYICIGSSTMLKMKQTTYTLKAFFGSLATRVSIVFCGLCIVLISIGKLRLLNNLDSDGWAIVLRRGGPSTMFWTPTEWGKTYHEIQPLEWIPLVLLILIFYVVLDYLQCRPIFKHSTKSS